PLSLRTSSVATLRANAAAAVASCVMVTIETSLRRAVCASWGDACPVDRRGDRPGAPSTVQPSERHFEHPSRRDESLSIAGAPARMVPACHPDLLGSCDTSSCQEFV